jgi:hypothetical protein
VTQKWFGCNRKYASKKKINVVNYIVLALMLAVPSLLSGCQKPQTTELTVDTVLVTVNGSAITQSELDGAIIRTLGEAAITLPSEVSANMLESLIASRAMALMQQKIMPEQKIRELELRAQAYREELLVRQYMKANAEPLPVTTNMVSTYYHNYPEEFGGKLSRTFEVISTIRKIDAGERKQLITELTGMTSADDWNRKATELKAKNLPVRYRNITLPIDLLEQPLRSLVENTPSGQVSQVLASDEVMRVKVIAETRAPTKPLSEVSADIRRKLAPVQFRKSVKQLSQQALGSAEIIYFKQARPTPSQGI